MIELECKLSIPDRKSIADKLRALGAEAGEDVFERNWTFDTEDQAVFHMGGLLRIRTLDGASDGVMTLKRPVPQHQFKAREEIETPVGDAAIARALLEGLGYRVDWYYEKRRQSWEHKECHIVLDQLPRLGAFIEIEGNDEESIRGLLEELGLDHKTHMQESYRVIYAKHCQQTGEAFTDWRFS